MPAVASFLWRAAAERSSTGPNIGVSCGEGEAGCDFLAGVMDWGMGEEAEGDPRVLLRRKPTAYESRWDL